MARKSRCRNLSEPAGKTKSAGAKLTGAINRTAIYIRLSLCDDIYFPKEDSIQTQLHMLREYVAKRSDLHYVTEYIDRGWTGANFQRPGFLQMIEDIQAGKINCIVVKDLSRFGRNYWETGYFLEVLLPQLKTRFISVVDGFDNYTSAPDALAIILKNIMNDFYSRDISRRLSDTVDLKNANAIYWGKQPYGYLSNPKQSFRLVFDPEVSYYVRWSATIKVESQNARESDKMKPPRRDSEWENGTRRRSAGRR